MWFVPSLSKWQHFKIEMKINKDLTPVVGRLDNASYLLDKSLISELTIKQRSCYLLESDLSA